jgi:hypothetical protein
MLRLFTAQFRLFCFIDSGAIHVQALSLDGLAKNTLIGESPEFAPEGEQRSPFWDLKGLSTLVSERKFISVLN